MRRARRRGLAVVLVTLGVVAAACSGVDRAAENAEAEVGERSAGGAAGDSDDPGDDGSAGTEGDGSDGTGPDDAGEATTASGDAGEAPGDEEDDAAVVLFGDLPMPCRDGDTAGYPDADQGVTADRIVIGTGDDRGFEVSQGLNVEIGDAMRAIVEHCNELGGINGREIDLNYYDAALFEVNNRMLEACETDFMLVGQGYVLDGTAERTRVECGIYTVPTYSVSPELAHGPRMLQPLPNPADQHGVGQIVYAAEQFPDEVSRTAVMFGNVPATADTKDKIVSAATSLGVDLGDVLELEYNASGEDDWTPFVLQMKNADIRHLHFVGTCVPNLVGLMETAELNDFEPLLTLETNFYVDVCAAANTTGVLDGAIVRIAMPPFEEAEDFPAVSRYLELVEGIDGARSQLGMQAMSAFLLWATAADACGAELTRVCVFDQIATIDDWTGGGLHAPSDPASNRNPGCEIHMRFEGTSYVREDPAESGTFDCEDNVGDVTGSIVDRAQLDENRVSTLYTG